MEYEKGILGVHVIHGWEVQHNFCSSLLPPCVHLSPWKKVVINGGLDQNKGTNVIIINMQNSRSFQGCLCIFMKFQGISRFLTEFAKFKTFSRFPWDVGTVALCKIYYVKYWHIHVSQCWMGESIMYKYFEHCVYIISVFPKRICISLDIWSSNVKNELISQKLGWNLPDISFMSHRLYRW